MKRNFERAPRREPVYTAGKTFNIKNGNILTEVTVQSNDSGLIIVAYMGDYWQLQENDIKDGICQYVYLDEVVL